MELSKIYNAIYKDRKNMPEVLLCLDPGHTTGYCVFRRGLLTISGQIKTVNQDDSINWNEVRQLVENIKPTQVVMEDYRVYSHKLERHSFSRVPTLRLIGAIDYVCWERSIPVFYQMATQAKGFVTDDKLKRWGLYEQGQRHSRDSMRHGLYFIITAWPKMGIE